MRSLGQSCFNTVTKKKICIFGFAFKKGVKQVGNKSTVVTDLWKVSRVVTTELSLTFLKLALGVFIEISVGPFTVEASHDFFEFEGFNLTWELGQKVAKR